MTDCSESDFYDNLLRVRETMKKNDRKYVALYLPVDGSSGEIFDKMAECIFGGTDLNCRSSRKREKGRKGRDTDAIIVSREGKSYAGLLNVVKEGIDDEDKNTTDNIDTIRQTKEGDMLITLRADSQKTGELRNILNKIGDIKTKISARSGAKRTTLHVKGMDAITTKEEVLAAIVRETGASRDSVRIGGLRPFYGSSKAVTVSVP